MCIRDRVHTLSISTLGCVSLFRISSAAPFTDCATMRMPLSLIHILIIRNNVAQKLWEKSVQVNKDIERFTVGRDREMDLYLAKHDVLGLDLPTAIHWTRSI